jgi:hypothetical protein
MHPGRDVSRDRSASRACVTKTRKPRELLPVGSFCLPFFFYFVPPLLSLFESEISKRGHVTEFLTAEDTMMPCPYSRQ